MNFLIIRPEQFNFLFFEHLGQKLKIGGRKKIKVKVNAIHYLRMCIPYNT